MILNFVAVIKALGANAAFRIINGARPPGNYMFSAFLPERNRPGYEARSGAMTIRSTMAGLVGADSPYPPSGIVDASTFNEQTAKIANEITLNEMAQRELQQLLATLGASDLSQTALRDTVLNFVDKLIVQPHLDTMEWMRGQALTTGQINWTFNQKVLAVDYGIPSANILTSRTGTAGYGGSASTFWTDMRSQTKLLKGQVRARIAHPDTIDMIISNPVNAIRVIEQDQVSGSVTIQKYVGSTEQLSTDARDKLTLVGYGLEAEILDPVNRGKTKSLSFMPTGKVIAIGNPVPAGFEVGLGSANENVDNELPIGYTHIAPTVEGGGLPGRWSDLRVPDDAPWQLQGRGVTNGLPVIEAVEKLVIATTAMT